MAGARGWTLSSTPSFLIPEIVPEQFFLAAAAQNIKRLVHFLQPRAETSARRDSLVITPSRGKLPHCAPPPVRSQLKRPFSTPTPDLSNQTVSDEKAFLPTIRSGPNSRQTFHHIFGVTELTFPKPRFPHTGGGQWDASRQADDPLAQQGGSRSLPTVSQPDFFIVGAPKCGTTALYWYLAGHPDIGMSKHKEPHFFAPDILDHQRQSRTLAQYLVNFDHATGKSRIGEASTGYLASRIAPREDPQLQFFCSDHSHGA